MIRRKHIGWTSLLVLLFTVSCHVPSSDGGQETRDIQILNLDAPLKISFDELVDSVSYIALAPKNHLIGDVVTIKRDDDLLFVQERKRLYAFSISGKFISEIGTVGNSSREHHYIQTFFLDKTQKHVNIVTYGKLLEFSYDGTFISSTPLPESAGSIAEMACYSPDSLIVCNTLPNKVDVRLAEYVLLSNNSGQLKETRLLDGIKNESQDISYSFPYHPMVKVENRIYAVSALSDTVYAYAGGNEMSPAFRVPIPNLAPSAAYLREHEDIDFFTLRDKLNEKGFGLGITDIAAVDGNFILSVNKCQTVITDGKEGVVIDSDVYDKNTDSYALCLFTGGISEEYMGYLEVEFLLKEKTKKHIMNGDCPQLKKLVETLSAEDNPVVFQYHFKKDLIEILKKKLAQQ